MFINISYLQKRFIKLNFNSNNIFKLKRKIVLIKMFKENKHAVEVGEKSFYHFYSWKICSLPFFYDSKIYFVVFTLVKVTICSIF